MKFADFQRLKKLMARTTSDNDAEALSSIRAANRLLDAAGSITWDRVLDRSVRVIQAFEPDPEQAPSEIPKSAQITALFDDALADDAKHSDSFKEFLESLHEQFERKGDLSPRQLNALTQAAEKVREARR